MIDVVKEQIKYTRIASYRIYRSVLAVSKIKRQPAQEIKPHQKGQKARLLTQYREDMICEGLEKVADKELVEYANALLENGIRSGYTHVPDKGWERIKRIYKKLGVEDEHLEKV